MKETIKKSNTTFMILSAIGILMVLDAHSGLAGVYDPINLFEGILSYNSFFMPMFVFISGYFIHIDKDLETITKTPFAYWRGWIYKKIKRLLIPYYAFGFLFGLLGTIFHRLNIMHTDYFDSLESIKLFIIQSVTNGALFPVCFPMWFLMALFMSYLVYSILRIFFSRIWNDVIAFVLFVGLGLYIIYYCESVNYEYPSYFQLVFKGVFFLQFLQMGQLYKNKIERIHISYSLKWIIVIAIAVISTLLQTIFGRITYAGLNNFKWVVPRFFPDMIVLWITTLMGIVFWLIISEWLAPLLGKNVIVNYISNNTMWILCTHMVFYRFLNLLLLIVNQISMGGLVKHDFSEESARYDGWYHYLPIPQFSVLYFIVALLGAIGSKLLFDKVKRRILLKYVKLK